MVALNAWPPLVVRVAVEACRALRVAGGGQCIIAQSSRFDGLPFASEQLAGSLSLCFLWYVCKGVAPPGLLVLCDLVGSWICPTLGFFFFSSALQNPAMVCAKQPRRPVDCFCSFSFNCCSHIDMAREGTSADPHRRHYSPPLRP